MDLFHDCKDQNPPVDFSQCPVLIDLIRSNVVQDDIHSIVREELSTFQTEL